MGVRRRLVLTGILFGAFASLAGQSRVNSAFPLFEDITAKASIGFVLDSGTDHAFILESNSAGVLLIDYDNDGWPDIYFVNGSTTERVDRAEKSRGNRLYRNNRNGTFTDVTAKAGVAGNGAWGMGGCIGDVDNNGYDDIFITDYGPDVLYLNNGDGTFRDASESAGIKGGNRWHSGCAFGDYDGDGDLDLYVSTYAEYSLTKDRETPYYVNYFRQVPRTYPVSPLGPLNYRPEPDEFYENVGRGRFLDVTEKSGIGRVKPGAGFAVVWGDVDNDGKPDILVANDQTARNLFRNNGDKTFTDVGVAAGVAFRKDGMPQASMGADVADYDNDGNLDITATNFSEDYNVLLHNSGNGTFTDVSQSAALVQVTMPFLGWGTQFVDLDLDGFQDLVAVNGHVNRNRGGVPVYETQQTGYRQRWLFFRNLRDGKFEEVGGRKMGGPAAQAHNSRGLAVGDLNNDGQMDLVISNQEETPSVLLNRGVPGNWILVKLRGTKSNRSAIGARVTLKAGALTQIREVKSGGSYLSQSDLRVHFGLGEAAKIDELRIRWPSGRTQIERDVRPNRIVTVREN